MSTTKQYVSTRDESVPLFSSRLLDVLSRVHWSHPLVLWLPIVGYMLYRAVALSGELWPWIGPLAIAGMAAWTLSEYLLHRFVFHYEPSSEWGKRLHFLMHGVHHDYPNDSRRLVMPPVVSICLAVPFFTFFWLLLGPGFTFYAVTAGFVVGYLIYDMMHYALHHVPFKNSILVALKRHHMNHHFHDSEHGFGVSTTFWDLVFRTTFARVRGGRLPR